jgi:hypothetical protein
MSFLWRIDANRQDSSWLDIRTAQACVESGRLRFFVRVTGEKSRIFFDDKAAAANGFPRAVAPPTPLETVEALAKVDRVLHGKQGVVYHRLLLAGDEVSILDRNDDITSQRDCTFEILLIFTAARGFDGALLVEMMQSHIARSA